MQVQQAQMQMQMQESCFHLGRLQSWFPKGVWGMAHPRFIHRGMYTYLKESAPH